MRGYARPHTLEEALGLIKQKPRQLLAGGTDIYPVAGLQIDGDVLDLTAIPALCGIITLGAGLRIGACTTWTAIAEADLPPALRALQQAALQVGGRQVQNAGTIGGNLCNASPAADGVPPLLALNAEVELAGPQGLRRLPLAQFLTGPRQTLRRPDEVMTAVILPEAALQGRSSFVKLGARAYLVISIAMVAARIQVADSRIVEATIAVGACSGVAQRVPAVEAALMGAFLTEVSARVRAEDVAAALSPIDDVRATGGYRITAATELVCRAAAGAFP
jgi:CO/xanthine dehydrogenase FAD-binding subunit